MEGAALGGGKGMGLRVEGTLSVAEMVPSLNNNNLRSQLIECIGVTKMGCATNVWMVINNGCVAFIISLTYLTSRSL